MTVLTGLKAMLGLQRGGTSPAEGAGAGQGFAALMAAQGAVTPKAAGEAATMDEGAGPALPNEQPGQPGSSEGQPVQSAEPASPAVSSGGEGPLSAPAPAAMRPRKSFATHENAPAVEPTDPQPGLTGPNPAEAVARAEDASPARAGSKVHKPAPPARPGQGLDPVSSDAPHAAIETAAETGVSAEGGEEPDEDRTLEQQMSGAPIIVTPAPPSPATPLPPQPVAASGEAAPSAPVAFSPQGQAGDPPPSPALPATVDTPIINAKPLDPAEAATLLQMVRDHVKAGGKEAVERGAPVPGQSGEYLPAIAAPAVHPAPAAPVAIVVPLPSVTQPVLAPTPAVDLSASLGAQVVDMGVSGQWIDGLARDIAGFSAQGAQGRFQIDAAQLGPIQVDIRQSAEGAAVSLTVATDLAEQALRQDSDRLKLDAGLSAVRISEVRVERAPAADAARNDGTGAQSGAQGQGQSSAHAQSHSQTQSHPHGQGRARENIRHPHKGGGNAAVLDHEQPGDTAVDVPRARYA